MIVQLFDKFLLTAFHARKSSSEKLERDHSNSPNIDFLIIASLKWLRSSIEKRTRIRPHLDFLFGHFLLAGDIEVNQEKLVGFTIV